MLFPLVTFKLRPILNLETEQVKWPTLWYYWWLMLIFVSYLESEANEIVAFRSITLLANFKNITEHRQWKQDQGSCLHLASIQLLVNHSEISPRLDTTTYGNSVWWEFFALCIFTAVIQSPQHSVPCYSIQLLMVPSKMQVRLLNHRDTDNLKRKL